jgi:hypothetical protein
MNTNMLLRHPYIERSQIMRSKKGCDEIDRMIFLHESQE